MLTAMGTFASEPTTAVLLLRGALLLGGAFFVLLHSSSSTNWHGPFVRASRTREAEASHPRDHRTRARQSVFPHTPDTCQTETTASTCVPKRTHHP